MIDDDSQQLKSASLIGTSIRCDLRAVEKPSFLCYFVLCACANGSGLCKVVQILQSLEPGAQPREAQQAGGGKYAKSAQLCKVEIISAIAADFGGFWHTFAMMMQERISNCNFTYLLNIGVWIVFVYG